MITNIKIDSSNRKLLINSPKGVFIEQLKGNLDTATSQGALVRVMEDKNRKKYVTKLALKQSGYLHLLNQLTRLQQMNKSKITIVPQIVDFFVEENYVYYTTPFVKGVSGYKNYLRNVKKNEEFIQNFRSLLENINNDLWSKGRSTLERKHFSKRHMYIINRGLKSYKSFMKTFSSKDRFLLLNSFNLKNLLTTIKASTKRLDEIMSESRIPKFSHGDLHFDNIIVNKANVIKLIDINGSSERKKSIIEFELARLLMSFYREVISGKHYKIVKTQNKKIKIVFTKKGEEILRRRNLAYDEIFKNQILSGWFKDKEQSRKIIKIMEALHFVSVFAVRPKEEILATYLLGTQILAQALKEIELVHKKAWG